jgi:hypothetical protein
MKQTPARTRFKQHFGHANHYLVTSLVALNHLEASTIAVAPAELHTSWSPQNKSSSIYRTRLFIQQSALASAVDSIDMYISLLYRKPNYIRDSSLSSALDGAKRSVMRKVLAVAEHYSICPVTVALVDVLITWRNNLVHELAENLLRDSTREVLEKSSKEIAETYRGLVPDQLSRKAEKGETLTFKETASLISATHHFVEYVDAVVIHRLNFSDLCCDIVTDALADESQKNGFKNKFFALPIEKRMRFVRNWLMNNHGISDLADSDLEASLRIPPNKNVG